MEALSLGFNFHILNNIVRRIDVTGCFENLFYRLNDLTAVDDDKKSWFKSRLVGVANQCLISPTLHSQILFEEHKRALKTLRLSYCNLIKA
uniref:Uncharacterized protein n=1 Tax=Trichobilharzia regenti TaxID=157069 RepID=A0AA85JXG1_TRIRE|nr:unnamed protein product [Trichobilharzia regenti]